jgi:hypothetical protein
LICREAIETRDKPSQGFVFGDTLALIRKQKALDMSTAAVPYAAAPSPPSTSSELAPPPESISYSRNECDKHLLLPPSHYRRNKYQIHYFSLNSLQSKE